MSTIVSGTAIVIHRFSTWDMGEKYVYSDTVAELPGFILVNDSAGNIIAINLRDVKEIYI